MANQLKMADVQAILTLHRHGWSDREIARKLGIHRETVGNYVKLAEAIGSKPASAPTGSAGALGTTEGSPHGPAAEGKPEGAPIGSEALARHEAGSKPASAPPGSHEAVVRAVEATLAAGSSLGPRGNASNAWPWREVILQKLDQGLHAQRIYQDLADPKQGYGYDGSYYSIRRLVAKLTGGGELPVRRMECLPGMEAQVDFGKGAPIVGPEGKRKTSWVFRIVLSHSRKGYSEAVFRQTTDEFLRCLENAFAHFGGVPKTLVIDNLKAAVSRADWFDPELCPKVRSFAEHYGIAILPTKPYTPRHKGKVENGVKYVKNNALKGLTFHSLAEENRHLMQWESTIADTRIHGTTRRQVIKVFEAVERPALLALPAGRFELFGEALRSVHRDGHVQVKGAYYSLPPEYLGQEVWARWDGRLVRLFDQRMRPIAVHAQKAPGQFATQSAHILPEKINSIERGTTWLLDRIAGIGPQAQGWAQAMLVRRGIEGVRVLQGLLSLRHKHGRSAVEHACQVALGHGAFHLRSLRQLIVRQTPPCIQQNFAFASQHEIIRPVADYGQFVREALSGQSSIQEERVA